MDLSPQYTYKNPVFLPPIVRGVQTFDAQTQSYGEEYNLSAPESFQANPVTFDEYPVSNAYNQSNDINNYYQDVTENQLNSAYAYGDANQINSSDVANQVDILGSNNQYDTTNINANEFDNQLNQYNFANSANYEGQLNSNTPFEGTNQITSNYESNLNNVDNISYQPNEVNNEIQTAELNAIQQNEENQIIPKQSTNVNVVNSMNYSNKMSVPQINMTNINSEANKKSKKIDSPRLIDPLSSPIPPRPPSPVLINKYSSNNLKNSEKNNKSDLVEEERAKLLDLKKSENLKELEILRQKELAKLKERERELEEEKKAESNILTKDEKILLKNANENVNKTKDFDIQSHFGLTLIKEKFGFGYYKVHKIGTPLLSHFEMPQTFQYKSPLVSPNSKYLACIAKGNEDFVYIWDINDLYWYKYKIASTSPVDGICFSHDSKSIIIVYKFSNPIMYDLSTGKKILELELNGEENNRMGFISTFNATDKESYFAYTSDKCYTLWSLKTGQIINQILDNSPLKIISNDNLICISDDLNVIIKSISTKEDLISFRLKGVESYKEILDAKCNKELTYFVYVIKQGIIKYIFNDKEYKGVQKFTFDVINARVSDDCKLLFKTNMQNISIFDIEKEKTICTILTDKFKQFRIDFNNKKLVLIDDICISIKNYEDEGSTEKCVWLDKNPKKFEDVKFSRDFKVLLARVNRNNAVAYDLKTGYIIKKWQNIDENWLDYAMTKYGGDKIATKSHKLLVKVWNFTSGKEEASFYGYDSYSFCFSGGGLYLTCGTKVGKEIARIWDIYKQKYGIFLHDGSNNNFHTVAHLTNPEPDRLICCSVDQKPLVFNTHTRELLYTCECPFRFEEVYGIQSDLRYDVFVVKGRDERKRNVGIMYKLSDGALLEIYENYSVLELAKDAGALICKCESINGGKLTSTNIKNLSDPLLNDFQIQSDKCQLLDDNRCAVIIYGDDFSKEFNLINVENGHFIGKISYSKKTGRNSAAYLTADPIDKELYFRYFEFLTPQETMLYKKKIINNVEDEITA